MPYLGNDLQVAQPSYRNIDDISGSFNSSTTSFPLRVSGSAPVPFPINSNQCLISVAGVVQRPDDSGTEGFRISGGNIIFSSAPSTGADFFGVILAGADYVNVGANFPSGSAAAPSITFDSDLDTGIYNSAANQVSVSTAGSERLRIDSAGQVEVVSLGTASAPAFSFTTDSNTGIYSPGADQVAISTSGAQRVTVDSSGNVNIGTTTAPGSNGKGIVIYDTSFPRLSFRNSTSGDANTDGTQILMNGSNFIVANTENGYTAFENNGSERLRITSAGLVGIGTTTPSYVLDVAGSARVKTGATGTPFIVSSGSDSQGFLRFGSASNVYGIYGGADYLAMQFHTDGSERARIDSSGRLLVGTSSTSAAANILVAGGDGARGVVNISSTAATPANGDDLGFISFNDSAHIYNCALIRAQRDGGTWTATTSKPSRLVFSTTADGASSPTERMRITSNGQHVSTSSNNLGLGGPGYVIQAVNNNASTSGVATYHSNLGNAGSANNTNCAHFYGVTQGVSFYYLYGNGTSSFTSDARKKKNIETTRDGYLDDLARLRVVKYNWINQADGDPKELGLIAQEVEEVFPGLVQEAGKLEGDDFNCKVLKGSVLPFMLLKALQEAAEKIEQLEAKVAALEAA